MGETAGFFEAQCSILERVAARAPLAEVLDAIVRLIERHGDGLLCTILLLDAERGCVVDRARHRPAARRDDHTVDEFAWVMSRVRA